MTVRPGLMAAAFLGAVALHAAIFFRFDATEERGAAPDGNEGILVALGTPAQIGAGGEDDVDQRAEEETVPDTDTPEPTAVEPDPQESSDTPPENVTEPQSDSAPPEATSVEIPRESVPDESTDVQPEPPTAIATPEPVAVAPDSPDSDESPEPEQVIPEPPQPAENVPDNTDPPDETSVAAIPLPQSRPEPPPSARRAIPSPQRQTAPSQQRPPRAQNSRSTEPRRSSGAPASGNSSNQSRQAQSGGGNDAERADYLSRLHSQLVRSKRYPRSARREGIEGVVQIGITVNRAGRVTMFRITRSSGHDVLDHEIRNMVSRAQPLPRMPASMEQSQITINMAIRFKLE